MFVAGTTFDAAHRALAFAVLLGADHALIVGVLLGGGRVVEIGFAVAGRQT